MTSQTKSTPVITSLKVKNTPALMINQVKPILAKTLSPASITKKSNRI